MNTLNHKAFTCITIQIDLVKTEKEIGTEWKCIHERDYNNKYII